MKAPKCRTCGEPRWSNQPHVCKTISLRSPEVAGEFQAAQVGGADPVSDLPESRRSAVPRPKASSAIRSVTITGRDLEAMTHSELKAALLASLAALDKKRAVKREAQARWRAKR